MEKNQRLQRYYKYGLLPILVLWLLITIFFNAMVGAFFLLGFVWPYLYYTPGFEEKAKSNAYKYSFLGNIFKFQEWIFSLMGETPPRWMVSMGRLLVPLFISGLVSILNPSWTPLWSIIGWGCFEAFSYLNEKKSWDLM